MTRFLLNICAMAIIKKKLRNEFIIRYYDEHYDEKNNLFIIMEYAENGNLTKFIKQNEKNSHDWKINKKLILQMTKGLSYIHNEGIVHRDLKSMNILLNGNNNIKICDFGISKNIDSLKSIDKNCLFGTLRWMDPELLKDINHSKESDIYSLGMIFWEIVSKKTLPFENYRNNEITSVLFRKEKEKIPLETPKCLIEIIENCWKEEYNERIETEEIIEKLEKWNI